MSDPSGNYGGWQAAAVGANNQAAQSILKQDYKDDATREEVVQLAIKVLSKTMDSTSLTAEKLELAELYLTPSKCVNRRRVLLQISFGERRDPLLHPPHRLVQAHLPSPVRFTRDGDRRSNNGSTQPNCSKRSNKSASTLPPQHHHLQRLRNEERPSVKPPIELLPFPLGEEHSGAERS